MGTFAWLSAVRQFFQAPSRAPDTDERLLKLYWNRAQLKKELSRLQDERHKLLEHLRRQEIATAQAQEQLSVLENHLGNPQAATTALLYFQLRALWDAVSAKLAHFAQQLGEQQSQREQRRQLMEFDQRRSRQLAQFDRRIREAAARADELEAQVKLKELKLAGLRGFWNVFRRRRLAEQIARERAQWDTAVMLVTDLSDERASAEAIAAPAFEGISVEGKRIVNTAVIAYAQQLTALLSQGGLAMLAKDTTAKRLYDVRYGSGDDCARLLALLRDALSKVKDGDDEVAGLKERTDALRAHAVYRNDQEAIPVTESIGTLPVPSAAVAGLQTGNTPGVNVLIDDYWGLYQALLQ
jgi:hypothetical protein